MSSDTETKEERRARKQAKKEAKLAAAEPVQEIREEVTETKEERKARRKAEKESKAAAETKVEEPKAEEPKAEETKEERKARRKAEKEAKRAAEDKDAEEKSDKKDKKDKKRKHDETAEAKTEATETTDVAAAEPEAKKSKKPKGAKKEVSTSAPVFSDEALSEQAKKAIWYAQQYKEHGGAVAGSAWKFNKARQGWLLRNFWNAEEVTESYLEDVVHYLKTVVGGARTGLVEKARKFLKGEEEVKEEVTEATKDESAADKPDEAMEVDGETKEPVVEEVAPVAPDASIEVRRARAEKLLAAMGEA